MKTFAATLAFAGAVMALPQGITDSIAPQETQPEGCSSSYDGEFQISVVNVTTTSAKRSLQRRQDDATKALTIKLADGVLTDDQGRTGYIAANNQFQFDKPAQTGAIYTAGWSVCSNGTLALGDSAVFYQCLSGDFYNLYDESTGEQCTPIYIDVIASGSSTSTASGAASQIADGQVTASAVSQISDGQIQATTAAPVTQISDGQIQASTAAAVVTQISDGQIQASTAGAAVTQISDGQIQAATTAAPVTQISDGQIQAPTGAVVTQISDGQIQAPTNGTTIAPASPSVSVYTGAANNVQAGLFGLAAAVVGVALL